MILTTNIATPGASHLQHLATPFQLKMDLDKKKEFVAFIKWKKSGSEVILNKKRKINKILSKVVTIFNDNNRQLKFK